MITVEVFHNVAQDEHGRHLGFWGYKAGHPLVKVASLIVDADTVEQAMDVAYRLLNVGDDPDFGTPDPQALDYRAARNRSLSVGDVLVFDGVAFTVADMGFEQVNVDPAQVVQVTIHGTTPLGDQ